MLAIFTAGLLGLSAASEAQTCVPSDQAAPIVLNQIGFETAGPKMAILRSGAADPVRWQVRSPQDEIVIAGDTELFGHDESAGERVHRIDFSALETAGPDYVLEACGARSRAFSIGAAPYGVLAEDSLRYFYLNRLGMGLQPAFTKGDQWARAGGFMDSRPTCFSGEDKTGMIWPGCDYRLETTGGWADAGDYGQYVVNGGVSVWTLQYAYERMRARGELEALDWDGARLPLPESRAGVSDILIEARYQLEFMLAMQVPEGEHVWVDAREPGAERSAPVRIDGSGLVHHKLHERSWSPLPLLPAEADEPRFLIPPTTAATLNLAATAAQASRLWRDLDPEFADLCLNAARRAFEAARRHPGLLAYDTFDGGGAYGDLEVADEFFWAAAELFLSTGDEAYGDAAAHYRSRLESLRPVFWASVDLLPFLSAQLSPDYGALRTEAEAVILETAQRYREEMASTGYHYPLPPALITWGSNANLLNRALILAAAHDIDPRESYRDGVVHSLDYLLGRNPLDQSYIAGYGARAMRHPHHRFWANGADPAFPEAPPGALSGGPNAQIMIDPIAREMEGRCAPQTCWADHVEAYALNEVAINWNAPLFAIAVFLEGSSSQAD